MGRARSMHGKVRNTYDTVVEELNGNRPLWWEDNTQVDLMTLSGTVWTTGGADCCDRRHKPSGSIQCGEFLY